MGQINSYNPSIDQTVQIFDRFYGYQQSVSSQEYDAVRSYFQSVFGTKSQAENFTVALFRVANLSNQPIMNLLQSMKGLNGAQVTYNLTYYLNAIQSPTTLLGIKVPVTPNYYVAHNVRQ